MKMIKAMYLTRNLLQNDVVLGKDANNISRLKVKTLPRLLGTQITL